MTGALQRKWMGQPSATWEFVVWSAAIRHGSSGAIVTALCTTGAFDCAAPNSETDGTCGLPITAWVGTKRHLATRVKRVVTTMALRTPDEPPEAATSPQPEATNLGSSPRAS